MNFDELQEIVKHLKKNIPCNTCKKRFQNEDVQVLSTYHNEGLFYFHCHYCKNQLIVHVAISTSKKEGAKEGDPAENIINIETKDAISIDQNEVLDMHNFLKNFNGDFKKLFK